MLSNFANMLFRVHLPVFCSWQKKKHCTSNVVVFLYLLLFGPPCKSLAKKN